MGGLVTKASLVWPSLELKDGVVRGGEVVPWANGAKIEAVKLKTASNKEVAGLFIPGDASICRFTILYSHANCEALWQLVPFLLNLSRCTHASIMAYEYVGYPTTVSIADMEDEEEAEENMQISDDNDSTSSHETETIDSVRSRWTTRSRQDEVKPLRRDTPSVRGCLEAHAAAFRYLTEERGLEGKEIVLFGRSIGSGPSIKNAAGNDASEVAALILLSPMKSCVSIVASPPVTQMLAWFDKFDNLNTIGGIGVPMLFLHGRKDEVVHVEHTITLVNKVNTQGRKNLLDVWLIDGATHNQLPLSKIFLQIRNFLERVESSLSLANSEAAAKAGSHGDRTRRRDHLSTSCVIDMRNSPPLTLDEMNLSSKADQKDVRGGMEGLNANNSFRSLDGSPLSPWEETRSTLLDASESFVELEWNELTYTEEKACRILGFNEDNWDSGRVEVQHLLWKDLSRKQQGAALTLGYTSPIWDLHASQMTTPSIGGNKTESVGGTPYLAEGGLRRKVSSAANTTLDEEGQSHGPGLPLNNSTSEIQVRTDGLTPLIDQASTHAPSGIRNAGAKGNAATNTEVEVRRGDMAGAARMESDAGIDPSLGLGDFLNLN